MRPLLAAALLLAGCATPSGPADAGPVVVLVSLDGFPATALEDPGLPVPTLRRLAREGASARAMTVVNPSVTWPNHTTLVTGVAPDRHGVLFNGLLVRAEGGPVRVEPQSRDALVRVPTVYDLAHRAGLRTAQVDWIPWQTGGTIDWAFEERPNPDGPVEREMIEAGLVTRQELLDWRKPLITWRDLIWTRAACHILRRHRPNLLLFHLLNTDATHHRYGPNTLAGTGALALADARVRELVDTIEQAGLRDRATVIVVSDHGFKAAKRIIRPNALLRQRGLLQADGPKVTSCKAHVLPAGGTAMAYLTAQDAPAAGIRDLLRGLEGVERIIEPAEYPSLGYPLPKDNPQMADFVLVAKPGYAFTLTPEGDPVGDITEGTYVGHHGYPASDPDMDGIFIAWGRGVPPGTRLERVRNIDVAPTVANLLGLKLEGAAGRTVKEIAALFP